MLYEKLLSTTGYKLAPYEEAKIISKEYKIVGKDANIPAHFVPISFATPVIISTVATTNKERKTNILKVDIIGIVFLSIGICLKNNIVKIAPKIKITILMIKFISKRDIKYAMLKKLNNPHIEADDKLKIC